MHRVRRLWSAAMIVVASIGLYVFSGCASQQQEANPPPESGSALQPVEPAIPAPQAEPTPAQPKPTESAPTDAAPEGFPLPIYAGMRVNKTLRTQTGDFKGMQVELLGDASPQAVADFYEAEFKKRNLNVSKMNQKTAAGEEILILGQSDNITAGVATAREKNQTRVVLSWSEKQKQ
jgi:hypothetical protein